MAFVFCRILSLLLMSFYENMTTLFLMSQNLKVFWSVYYYKINAKGFFRIFKTSIVFNYVFTAIDLAEISNCWFSWFRIKITKKNEGVIFRRAIVQIFLALNRKLKWATLIYLGILLETNQSIYNPGQNIWNKIEKYSKTG